MRNRRTYHSVSTPKVAGGVLIGAALGAATAFLFSNSGKHIRHNLARMCSDLSEQAQDLAHQVAEKSGEITDDVSEYLSGNGNLLDSENQNLIIGGLAGAAILGLSTLFLSGKEHPRGFRHELLRNIHNLTKRSHRFADEIQEGAHEAAGTFDNKVSSWVKVAQRFLDNIDGCAQNACASNSNSYHEDEESPIDKMVDWAAFGIRLYQTLKK